MKYNKIKSYIIVFLTGKKVGCVGSSLFFFFYFFYTYSYTFCKKKIWCIGIIST